MKEKLKPQVNDTIGSFKSRNCTSTAKPNQKGPQKTPPGEKSKSHSMKGGGGFFRTPSLYLSQSVGDVI